MTERLSDVEARIGSVRQLSAVVTAMRGIAAARAHEAGARLDGVRAYAATVGGAIAQALALLADSGTLPEGAPASPHHLIFALCAEHGFAGGFNRHVLDAAGRLIAQGTGVESELLVIGDRGMINAAERDMSVSWSSPMAAHVDQITPLANRLADRLVDRAVGQVSIIHAVPGSGQSPSIVEKTLIPFDYSRFPAASAVRPPLITLSPRILLARLAEEYIFAELCEALLLSFAAENEARMRAMVAARDNVGRKLDELRARSRLLRQEQITSEVIELAAGAAR